MKAFEDYRYMPPKFWALVKFVSQELKYTESSSGRVRAYSEDEIINLLDSKQYNVEYEVVRSVSRYSAARAELLNNTVKRNLMDIDSARTEFEALRAIHSQNEYRCKIPMNKQSGAKRHILYLTAIVNILTERTLRLHGPVNEGDYFDDDPNKYLYIVDDNQYVVGVASRHMDGAYPNLVNPKIVWEIKEYYGTTSFGSRVADGVYETQLDGYELDKFRQITGRRVYHALIVDDYYTWWIKGKSYLCRLIDILNEGLVDEIIVGREVLTRWPEVIRSVIV